MPPLPLVSSLTRTSVPAPAPRPQAGALEAWDGEFLDSQVGNLRDALKLRAQALPSVPYADGIKLALAVDDLSDLDEGDAYDAAFSASKVLTRFSPALDQSVLGAGINAILIGTGAKTLRQEQHTLVASVDNLFNSPVDRVDAMLGTATSLAKLSVIYRSFANAILNVTHFGLRTAAKIPALAPDAARLTARIAKAAATPTGRALGFLNKWIPLVNATWILLAIKTSFDVHENPASSRTSRWLSALNVGCASSVVFAGVGASCPAFFATVIGGIAVDMMLAQARRIDQRTHDTDALVVDSLKHPLRSLSGMAGWVAALGKAVGRHAERKVLHKTPPPQTFSPDRLLVARKPQATPAAS